MREANNIQQVRLVVLTSGTTDASASGQADEGVPDPSFFPVQIDSQDLKYIRLLRWMAVP